MIRMPVQLGASAARQFLRGFAEALGGVLGAVLCALLALESYELEGFTSSVAGKGFVGLIALAFVAFGVSTLRRAYRARASDAILDERGVRIEGGPHHGKHFSYALLTPRHLVLEHHGQSKKLTTRLVVRGDPRDRARGATELGVSIDATETTSFRALADTLAAVTLAGGTSPVDAKVLCCAGCGAPLVPVDAPEASCPYCGRTTALPEPLREQVRASALLAHKRPRVEKLVRKLMRQPGATSVNRLAAVLFGLSASTPFLAVAAGAYQLLTADSFRYVTLWGLMEFPFFAALGSALLLRARIVDRVALGLLTLDFSAKRSDKNELVCRGCGGPLPILADAAAVRCVYCGSDNVLGVDLRQSAGRVAREHTSLEAVLARRTRRRLVWAAGGAVSVLFVLHAVKLLSQGFEHNRTTDPTKLARFGAEVGAFDRSNQFPAGSPDGNQVAFVELDDPDAPDGDAALRVVHPGKKSGSSPEAGVVVARGRALRDPAWVGPSALLVVVKSAEGRAALRRVAVTGGAWSELHVAEDIESPSASEDGRRIAFAERAGTAWQITLLGAGERRSIGPGRMPELHRLGDRLVFIRELDGLPKPFVLELDRAAAEPRPLFTPNRFRYADPTWAPCRAFVAVSTNEGWDTLRTGTELDTWNVVAVDTRRGGAYALTRGNAAARHLSWTGRRIYFDTDGQPDGQHAVYPLEPDNEFHYGPYARSCR